MQKRANIRVYSIVMVKTKESDIGNKEVCTQNSGREVSGKISFCDLDVGKGESC